MKIKRVLAYIIDMFFITMLASVIFSFTMTASNSYSEYEQVYNESYEYILNSGSADLTHDQEVELLYKIQKVNKPMEIIRIGLLILYFGVLAYLLKGRTLGKKIFKLQVVPINGNNLNPGLFMLRTVLLTNFIPNLISLIAIIVCSKDTWYTISNITSNISTIMIFLMLGFVLFRDDERGLHDIITGTKVVSTIQEEK